MTIKKRKQGGLTRRQFLKWTGIGAGAAGISTLLPFSLRRISRAEAAEITDYTAGSWTRSCCNMCGGQCGVDVYVEGGVVRKVEPVGGATGVVTNPNAVSNVSSNFVTNATAGDIGRLCCKGNAALKSLYDPDRLTTPMMRVGARGSDDFEPITWDEAIEATAVALTSVRATWGARSLVWFGEDHSFTHPQKDLCDAFGTPNYSNHSNLCDTSRKSAFRGTIGDERPLADIENTDLFLCFGWNLLSALKFVHLAPIFTRARMNNANFHFIYVDPCFNTTASKADRWVAPRPGTDGALALAVAKQLIDDGTALDTTFINDYTLGYDEFTRFLDGEASTPAGMDYSSAQWMAAPYNGDITAWASAVTGVPTADIDAIADKIIEYRAAGRKICIDAWSGPGHHSNAHQSGRAIACLALLLGTPDTSGAMVSPLRSGPSARSTSGFGWPSKDGWRLDGKDNVTIPATYTYPDGSTVDNPINGSIKKKYSYSHGSGIYVEQIRRMIEQTDFVGNPYPTKACGIVFQNLMMNVPNSGDVEAALSNMEFVFVVDTHMSETAHMADIVFPGAQYLERNDVNANWVTFRSVGYRQQVVAPWFGGMTEWQLFLEIGAAMGFGGFKTAPENMTDEAMQAAEWANFLTSNAWGNQMTFDELKTAGTWIETSSDPSDPTDQSVVLGLIPATTDGATSTPTGGTHFRKYKKTSSSAAGYTVETLTVGSETKYVVKNATGARVGITTSATVPATFEVGFGTDSRYAQFWDVRLADYFAGTTLVGREGMTAGTAGDSVAGDVKYHPLPWFSFPDNAPAWLASGGTPGSGTYPLFFVTWKEVEHTHTRTFNNAWLMEMKGENRLWVHPTVASPLGIEEGDFVWVQTPWGLAKVRAHVTYSIQAECVGWARGFGHWRTGSIAKGKGAHDNALFPSRAELHSGQAVNKEAPCRIYKEV